MLFVCMYEEMCLDKPTLVFGLLPNISEQIEENHKLHHNSPDSLSTKT